MQGLKVQKQNKIRTFGEAIKGLKNQEMFGRRKWILKVTCSQSWSDSTVGKSLALYAGDLGLILDSPYNL